MRIDKIIVVWLKEVQIFSLFYDNDESFGVESS